MPDISDLNQVASDNDRLAAAWVNQVATRIKDLESQLAGANQQISSLKSQVTQAFSVSPLTGLQVQYTGGRVKLDSGAVASISNGNITLANNAVQYLFVNSLGAIQVNPNRPILGLELARITTLNGQVTEILNYPLFEIKPALPDFNDFATKTYAQSQARTPVALARKSTTFSIPVRDTYYQIPFEALAGTGFNTAGLFTAPADVTEPRKYNFHCQVRVDTTAPNTNPNLAVKLSLFSGGSELGLPLAQMESAEGDITINASNAEPLLMAPGQTASIRVYLTQGIQARVREGSVVQVWRLPD